MKRFIFAKKISTIQYIPLSLNLLDNVTTSGYFLFVDEANENTLSLLIRNENEGNQTMPLITGTEVKA